MTRARSRSNAVKVLVIMAFWTLFQVLSYTDSYLLIGDLVHLGKLQGSYAFWPDFAGNVVLGLVGGALGGALLVLKVNAGYRHKTFLSGIVNSVVLFALIYLGFAVCILLGMAFVYYAVSAGPASGLRSAWENVRVNLYTPSFLATMVIWGFLVSGTQFMLQVNDKFGPGVLWKLLTGRYYHPHEEERIFMFLDLRSSTPTAERLGHRRFFELLRELFQDITIPVLDSLGEIYQYVGDEVVVTWTVPDGVRDDNCLRCFFRIDEALAAKRVYYLEQFGLDPEFKAGVHVGEATVGEIGVVKKDIVYSGDVLNTTSRIQEECNRHRVRLLASADLLGRLGSGGWYRAVPMGEIPLRGRSERVRLSAIATDLGAAG